MDVIRAASGSAGVGVAPAGSKRGSAYGDSRFRSPYDQVLQSATAITELTALCERDPWLYQNIVRPAEIVAGWPLKIRRMGRAGEAVDVQEGPVAQLLTRRPNDHQDAYEWWVESYCWLQLAGNFFWYLGEGATRRSVPRELEILDADILEPIYVGGKIAYWWHRRRNFGASARRIQPEELVYSRKWRPRDDVLGMGARPALSAARLRYLKDRYNHALISNGGRLDEVYTTEQGLTTEQCKTWAEWYAENWGSPDAAGSAIFLASGWMPGGKSALGPEMGFDGLDTATREDIGAAGGVAASTLGSSEGSTWSFADTNRQALIDYTCLPMARRGCAFLNHHILPRFGADLFAVYDTSAEPVMLARAKEMASEVRQLANPAGGVPLVTPNEARELIRSLYPQWSAVIEGDLPGGDAVWIPVGLIPEDKGGELREYAPTFGAPPSQDEDDDEDNEDEPADRSSRSRIVTRDGTQAFIDGVMVGSEEFERRLAEAAEAFYRAIIESVGPDAAAELGQDFDLTSHVLEEWAETAPQVFRRHFPRTTMRRLRREVATAFRDEDSLGQIIERVDTVFLGQKRNAITVAVTETNGAWSFTEMEAWRQAGGDIVDGKEWLPNTERHQDVPEVNGVIGLSERFRVGDALLLHPGARGGPAREVCGCMCGLNPHLTETARARLRWSPTTRMRRVRSVKERWVARFERTVAREVQTYRVATIHRLRQIAGGLDEGEKSRDRGAISARRIWGGPEAPVGRILARTNGAGPSR
jgi:phage portal protein BeeE